MFDVDVSVWKYHLLRPDWRDGRKLLTNEGQNFYSSYDLGKVSSCARRDNAIFVCRLVQASTIRASLAPSFVPNKWEVKLEGYKRAQAAEITNHTECTFDAFDSDGNSILHKYR